MSATQNSPLRIGDHRAGDEDDGDDGEDLPEAQATTGGMC